MTPVSSWIRRAAFCALLAATAGAFGGGGIPVPGSATFENGSSIVRPGELVNLRFLLNDYIYGSNEFAYMAIAVVPASEPVTAPATRIRAAWTVYGLVSAMPNKNLSLNDKAAPYFFEFAAPQRPGKYKILMGSIPVFLKSPLGGAGDFKRSFLPIGADKEVIASAITRYPGTTVEVARFEVSTGAPSTTELMRVYLRLGGVPPYQTIPKGGLQEKPMQFSWDVGPEFKGNRTGLQYRYRMQPDNDDWGAWTIARRVDYAFLLKGVHLFQVQARNGTEPNATVSEPASYQFTLQDEFISHPILKGPGPSTSTAPAIDLHSVYAASRALVVGIWQFDDGRNFPDLGQQKIAGDVAAITGALQSNGFAVTTLSKERVTKEDVLEALAALVGAAERNDRLFVYFSSHGFPNPNKPSDGYLATSDCQYSNPAVRCLSLKHLEEFAQEALDSHNAKQMLFAVDSCFSGLGVVLKSIPAGPTDLTQLAGPKGAFMLTAGMANQKAQIDPKLNMSTFTYYLAEGLNGRADIMDNSGLITLSQLFVYVQYKVAQKSATAQIPMLGRISGDGEMIFWPAKK